MHQEEPIKILNRLFAAIKLTMILLTVCTLQATAQAPAKEYQVKAVFLFNFSKFITWPPASFSEPQSPFVIGIIGQDPFGSFLDQTIAGEKVTEHPVTVVRYNSPEKITGCHILFIKTENTAELQKILSITQNQHILTVGDHKNFTALGGIIGFVTIDHKIRLQINTRSAKNAELVISSKLLRLSEIQN